MPTCGDCGRTWARVRNISIRCAGLVAGSSRSSLPRPSDVGLESSSRYSNCQGMWLALTFLAIALGACLLLWRRQSTRAAVQLEQQQRVLENLRGQHEQLTLQKQAEQQA